MFKNLSDKSKYNSTDCEKNIFIVFVVIQLTIVLKKSEKTKNLILITKSYNIIDLEANFIS